MSTAFTGWSWSWMGIVNFLILQWLGVRWARLIYPPRGAWSYGLIGPVLPLTGWWSPYVGCATNVIVMGGSVHEPKPGDEELFESGGDDLS